MKYLRAIKILVSFAVLLITSYLMYTRPLWGYLPLFQFLSMFAVAILISRTWLIKDAQRTRWLKLSLFSGILFAIGFPPSPIFIGMAVGFVPLLIIEKEMITQYEKAKPGLLWRYLFTAFWLWNILSTFWVANTAFFAGILANVVNAALMTVPWIIYHRLTWNTNRIWKYVFLGGLWLLFEYLHSSWEISWPWLTLGNGLATVYPLIQWYEFTGYFGGSVWIWMMNIAVFYCFYGLSVNKKKAIGVACGVIILPCLISLMMYFNYKEVGTPVDVTVVQPNYEPHYQKFNIPEEIQADKIVRISAGKIDPKTQLIIYPETLFDPVNLDEPFESNASIQKLHKLFILAPDAHILAGIGGHHKFLEKPDRTTIRQHDQEYYELYNAALMLEKDSSRIQEYHKSKFVPGAEIFPFKKVLLFLIPLVKKLGGTYEGFAPQDEPDNFIFEGMSVAPIICYESIYGGWVTGYVRKGAGLLAIVTNDGWWDNTPGHLQHLAIGRLRAIENRKDIVRSANTGTSCFIDQRGDIRMETAYETDDAIRDVVYHNTKPTFYSRHGDYIIYLVGFLTLTLGIIAVINLWRRKAEIIK